MKSKIVAPTHNGVSMYEGSVHNLRGMLVRVGKQLYDHGLVVGTEGNISARIPETDRVLIKPSGVPLGFLKAEDLIVVDLDGNRVEGELAPSIETPLHTAIYRVRSDVQGVVHTHAPFSTAFGIAGTEIIPLQVEMFLYILFLKREVLKSWQKHAFSNA